MNTLRRKLQFQLIQNGKLKLIIISPDPIDIETIDTDIEFYCEIEIPEGYEEYIAEVYFNNVKIGTLENVSNNTLSGYAAIPNRLVGYGTTYIVDNNETPVTDIVIQHLNFVLSDLKGNVNIYLKGNKDFIIGEAKGFIDLIGNENIYDYGFVDIECSCADTREELEF